MKVPTLIRDEFFLTIQITILPKHQQSNAIFTSPILQKINGFDTSFLHYGLIHSVHEKKNNFSPSVGETILERRNFFTGDFLQGTFPFFVLFDIISFKLTKIPKSFTKLCFQ